MRFGIRKDPGRETERSWSCGERGPSLLRQARDALSCCSRKKLGGCLQKSDGWILGQIAAAGCGVAGMLLTVVV